MIKQDAPLFSNNCGKIYRNKVVFAAHKQPIDPQDIKAVSLRKSMSKGNIFFVMLPNLFFIIPFFVHEFFEKLLFIAIGFGLVVITFFMTKRDSFIHVTLSGGKRYRFKIWYGYVREAQKFVDETRKLVARRSTDAIAEDTHEIALQNREVPVVK